MKIRSLALLLALTALAPLAHAQFTGDYALTPPSTGSFTTNTTIGAWSLTFNSIGSGSGSLNTSGAPNSFLLGASATGMGTSANSRLGIDSVDQKGIITFDFNVFISSDSASTPPSMGSFTYGLNGNTSFVAFNTTNSVVWNVEAGDSIFFNAYGAGSEMMNLGGGAGGIGGPGGIGGIGGGAGTGTPTPSTGSAAITISNFTFTPTAVPEPAEFAAGAGLLGLGAALWRRKNARG